MEPTYRVCANPACEYHKAILSPAHKDRPHFDFGTALSKRVRISRYPYYSKSGQLQFYYCSVCHYAVTFLLLKKDA